MLTSEGGSGQRRCAAVVSDGRDALCGKRRSLGGGPRLTVAASAKRRAAADAAAVGRGTCQSGVRQPGEAAAEDGRRRRTGSRPATN